VYFSWEYSDCREIDVVVRFRRKQAAPRSRLVRQCDECDFSSSIANEFKTHLKFEHGHEQIFFCEQCRYYTSSSFDYNLHLHTHQSV